VPSASTPRVVADGRSSPRPLSLSCVKGGGLPDRMANRGMHATDPRPESERIEFLLKRDGPEATRAWVQRTLAIYRKALRNPAGHGADPVYRPRFEQAIQEFEEWLAKQ